MIQFAMFLKTEQTYRATLATKYRNQEQEGFFLQMMPSLGSLILLINLKEAIMFLVSNFIAHTVHIKLGAA